MSRPVLPEKHLPLSLITNTFEFLVKSRIAKSAASFSNAVSRIPDFFDNDDTDDENDTTLNDDFNDDDMYGLPTARKPMGRMRPHIEAGIDSKLTDFTMSEYSSEHNTTDAAEDTNSSRVNDAQIYESIVVPKRPDILGMSGVSKHTQTRPKLTSHAASDSRLLNRPKYDSTFGLQLSIDSSLESNLSRSSINTFAVSSDLLPRIDESELRKILAGDYADQFDEYIIIDCRFPYEYEGGHIESAINIALHSDLESRFITNHNGDSLRRLLIFHCEYSIFRGPTMAGHLRKTDRLYNADSYPNLLYPDIVVLDGGYKRFFDLYRHHCVPQAYVPMKDTRHKRICELEMSKVLQASKLTRSKSLNQFQPRLAASDTPLSPFSTLLSENASSHWAKCSKVNKRGRDRFTQSLVVLPHDLPKLDSGYTFDDDFAPPSTHFHNHCKNLSSLLISVHSSLLLVCSDLFSAFSSSDSLLEAYLPFDCPDYSDSTTSNSGNLLAGVKYTFPKKARRMRAAAASPTISSPLTGIASTFGSAASSHIFSEDFINDTPVDYVLPKHLYGRDLFTHTLDIEEAGEESD